jgi:hypothetical protein
VADTINVRAVATSNITLSGTQTVDTVSLVASDPVLVIGQTDGTQNGAYRVASGAWTRHESFDTDSEMVPGQEFFVAEGSETNRGRWHFTNPVTPTVGVTILSFSRYARRAMPSGVTGTYALPTLTFDQGVATAVGTSGISSAYIEGLGLRYVSTTQIALDPGAAYIPGLGRVVSVDSSITATRLTGSNAYYYAFLYETNGVGQLELSSTAPDVAYFGSARTKEGDPTKRYLGAVRNDPSGNLMRFEMEVLGGATCLVQYQDPHDGTVLFVSIPSPLPTSLTTVNVGPTASGDDKLVSPAARTAIFGIQAGGQNVRIGYDISGGTSLPGLVKANTWGYVTARLSPTQQVYITSVGASSTVDLFVVGYYERR